MAKIVIPYEITNRELVGKLWLATSLADAGHIVFTGTKKSVRKNAFNDIQPDICFFKDASYDEGRIDLLERLDEEGCFNVVIDTEGGVIDSRDDYLSRRLSKTVLDKLDLFFAWGEVPASIVRDRTDFPDDRVWVTGNPRFDLLLPDLREIYREQAGRLKSDFGDFILVNTNMVVANPYEDFVSEQIMDSLPKEVAERRLQQEYLVLDRLVEGLKQVAPNQNRKFVVRPHPTENPTYYREQFEGIDAITVNHNDDVRPWIFGADAVVHYRSTTGIESALLNTLPLAFEPSDGIEKTYGSPLPRRVSDCITQMDEIPDKVDQIESKGFEYQLSSNQKAFLIRYFANVEDPAAPRITDILTQYSENREPVQYSSPPLIQQFKRAVKTKSIGPYIQRITMLNRGKNEYSNHKRPPISVKKVQEIIEHFHAYFPESQFDVSRCNYNNEMFRIVAK